MLFLQQSICRIKARERGFLSVRYPENERRNNETREAELFLNTMMLSYEVVHLICQVDDNWHIDDVPVKNFQFKKTSRISRYEKG